MGNTVVVRKRLKMYFLLIFIGIAFFGKVGLINGTYFIIIMPRCGWLILSNNWSLVNTPILEGKILLMIFRNRCL